MHVLSGSVLAYIDRFMINHYYDESSVGVYTLGYMLGSSITLLFGLTATYFEPYIYGKKVTSSSGIEYSLGVYSRVLFFLVSASGLVVLVFSHFYLTKVFGDDFGAAVNIVPVVLYAHIFNIVYLQGNYRLTAHEKTGVIAISTFIASVINVVVNMLLIPRLGIMGAAYATFISYIFLSVFMFFLSYKKAGVADHGSRDVMLYGSVLFVFISGVMLNELIYYCSGLFLIILMFSYRIYKDDAQMLRRIFMH
jgi:O-antigen/teichoic acid export membrane protein